MLCVSSNTSNVFSLLCASIGTFPAHTESALLTDNPLIRSLVTGMYVVRMCVCLAVCFYPSAEGIFEAVNAEKDKQEQKDRQKFNKSNTRKFEC